MPRRSFTLFAGGILALTLVGGLQAAELPEDNFGFSLGDPVAHGRSALPGEFRLSEGGVLWIGGGLSGTARWGEWDGLVPSTLVTRYRFDGLEEAPAVEESHLPDAIAWAAVATKEDPDSLLVAGGFTESGFSAAVRHWRFVNGEWSSTSLPDLPRPLAFAGAVVLDDSLYIAGGWSPAEGPSTKIHRLALGTDDAQWESEPLPVEHEWMQPQLLVRRDERVLRDALFLFGGWRRDGDGDWEPVTTNLKYHHPESPAAGWTELAPSPQGWWLAQAAPLGPSHWISIAVDTERRDPPLPALLPAGSHAANRFLRYHLFTDTWAQFATHAGENVTYAGFVEKDELLLGKLDESGKEKIFPVTITSVKRHFVLWDYAVMAAYLGGLVLIGTYFNRREKGTEDFFLGGRKVPWWAAGLSIYATGTSAISFMAIPAKTYATDWLYFIGMAIFPFFTVTIAAFVFIPMLRRLEITTVMEYFELRFGRSIRLLMSAITVLGQVAGRMSITLLLPSIALTAVTGMDIYTCILLMGILSTLYTALGGINAVIWTDVLQVFVLFGGAILSITLVLARIDGGAGEVFQLALADNKFNLTDWSWDFTTATMWVMMVWAISDVFGKGLGQEGLQRAFSTKGVKEARRSMITCAVVALPAGFLFYGIGTALYAFYQKFPNLLDPTLQTDAIFPLFIAQQLPVGLAGLVISGLFAASMSTLDTAMNTSATIVTRDFYSIWRKTSSDREQLLLAKGVTIFCGIFGTGVALYMASFENLGSLWDMFSILLGVIGGGLGGVGFLALCTTRANSAGTLAGAAVTAVSMVLIKQYTHVHFFTFGTVSLVIGSTTGYLFSIAGNAFPRLVHRKDLTGLTLWTPAPKETHSSSGESV